MSRLVQHIKIDMPGIHKEGLYCYGEASFEANQAMQEPLEKLYKYENLFNTEENIENHIEILNKMLNKVELETRFDKYNPELAALRFVVDLLESRLEELV